MENSWKKNIALFLLSQTLSLFGSSLVQYAIMWYITLHTESGSMMTVYIICGFLPTFFLSPFAGVWADRYNRKKLIMLSDSFIAVTTLILAILFLMGQGSILLLLFASVLRAVGSGIQMPAVGAIIPQLVPENQLTRINGINNSIQALTTLVSPMFSGLLFSLTTIEKIFFIDVVTAAIAVLILMFFLRVPSPVKSHNLAEVSYFKDLHEGIVYIKNHAYVKKFFLFCAFFIFLAAPASFLTPLQVARSFGEEVWRLTAIEIAFSSGMILGGLIMASWGGLKNRIHTMTLSCFIFGVCTFLLGLIPVFSLYLLVMLICGIFMPFFNTPATVLLQEKVEPDLLGRVFSVLSMISSSMMPLGMLVFGPLADLVRIELLLVGTGFLLCIQSFFLIGSKELVEAGKPSAG